MRNYYFCMAKSRRFSLDFTTCSEAKIRLKAISAHSGLFYMQIYNIFFAYKNKLWNINKVI